MFFKKTNPWRQRGIFFYSLTGVACLGNLVLTKQLRGPDSEQEGYYNLMSWSTGKMDAQHCMAGIQESDTEPCNFGW